MEANEDPLFHRDRAGSDAAMVERAAERGEESQENEANEWR